MPAYQQIELAESFIKLLGPDQFRLAVLGSLSSSRKEMGWVDDNQQPYLLRFNDSAKDRSSTLSWINDADIVIHGRFPIKHVRARIKAGKLTYAYQERLWKKGFKWSRFVSRLPHLIKNYYSVDRANYHLLAAGRYAADDLQRLGLFKNRAWKFGYFIAPKQLPLKPALTPLRIIWTGRLIPLKRPMRALQLAASLKQFGIAFHLELVGDGELRSELELHAKSLGIADSVHFLGWQSVAVVNERMASAHIMLMSSDHREGWGVVINEAINNGCYPVVCDDVGSARWLIEDGVTGVVYQDRHFQEVCDKLAQTFVSDPNAIALQALQGHKRMTDQWSSDAAAARLVSHARYLQSSTSSNPPFVLGPCSAVTD